MIPCDENRTGILFNLTIYETGFLDYIFIIDKVKTRKLAFPCYKIIKLQRPYMKGAASIMKKALIFHGGWPGHDPALVANRFAGILRNEGFEVEIYDTQDCLDDYDHLMTLDLIIPIWTMGEIEPQRAVNLCNAVGHGVGLAGCHGGMCDSFRQNVLYQFMTGSQWVAHPGMDGIDYTVNIIPGSDPIVEGLADFSVCSEQYYLHVDPGVKVMATTRFPTVWDYSMTNPPVDMPVVYTKSWGLGRVFYSSLGHQDNVFEKYPTSQEIQRRGMLWAAESKQIAKDKGEEFKFSYSPAKANTTPRCFL